MSISLRDVRFRYPAAATPALDGVSLAAAAGEVTWVTGALGSGASTLLLVAAGLAPRLTGGERSGVVSVGGVDPLTSSPLALGIGYVGPSPALQLSGIAADVRDEVGLSAINLGLEPRDVSSRVDEALARFGVAELALRPPARLSGGETQRVVLAAVAAGGPVTWLLDEPFAPLDRRARHALAATLRSLAALGHTVLIASDDADIMLATADRMVVLERGRVVASGVPRDLLAGDDLPRTGAPVTDAARLARAAGMVAPRPFTTAGLIETIGEAGRGLGEHHAVERAQRDPVLQFDGVRFRYSGGPAVLDATSFTVERGTSVGVFGENGAGKSTILRLAMALEHPITGRVLVDGSDTAGRAPEELAPRVALLFQQPERQLFATTVWAEMRFTPHLLQWDASRIDAAATEVLEQLGLRDVADEHPGDLPLPLQRLVALGALLICDPELLLLDEPTAGLDDASRERVVEVVRSRDARGRTTVAVTHDHVFAHEALTRALVVEGHGVRGLDTLDGLFGAVLDEPAAWRVGRRLGGAGVDTRRAATAARLARHLQQ